ncbi:MAG: hypothetical protein ACTSW1_17995 [Candidatus Hodarchaeales archaeon]
MESLTQFEEVYTFKDIKVYFIHTNNQLITLSNFLAEYLKKKPILAVDQERAPYHKVYYQRPCLLQLGTEDNIFFIDLNSMKNLKPLNDIFLDKMITKVFFDCPWDLFYFKDVYNQEFSGIFDIQVVSSLLVSYKNTVSLEILVKKELKVLDYEKPKSEQKSNWCTRPLSTKQIKYASEEIFWFIPLYKALLSKIKSLGLDVFLDYIHDQIQVDLPSVKYNPFTISRIREFETLTEEQKYIAYKIGLWRDEIAKRNNKPSFFILSNRDIVPLIRSTPMERVKILRNKRLLSKNDIKSFLQLFKSQNEDITVPFDEFRTTKNTNVSFIDLPELHKRVLIWRNEMAQKLNLPKRFILSKYTLTTLDYSDSETLIENMWFSNKKDPVCQELQRTLKQSLQENPQNQEEPL